MGAAHCTTLYPIVCSTSLYIKHSFRPTQRTHQTQQKNRQHFCSRVLVVASSASVASKSTQGSCVACVACVAMDGNYMLYSLQDNCTLHSAFVRFFAGNRGRKLPTAWSNVVLSEERLHAWRITLDPQLHYFDLLRICRTTSRTASANLLCTGPSIFADFVYCKFPTEVIIGAQRFNVAPKFPQNQGFQPHFLHSWTNILGQEQNFPTVQNLRGGGNCPAPHLPRRHCIQVRPLSCGYAVDFRLITNLSYSLLYATNRSKWRLGLKARIRRSRNELR